MPSQSVANPSVASRPSRNIAGRFSGINNLTFAQLATPLVASAVIVTIVARLAGCPVILPVMVGAVYALTLTVLAVAGIVRKG